MHHSSRWPLTRVSKYLLVILLVLAVFAGFVSGLGYQLPQADVHPDWQEFPQLKTTHLVVERVVDFDSLYGHRYRLSAAMRSGDPDAVDSLPVTAVRVLGHRVNTNRFQIGGAHVSNNSGMVIGPSASQGFNQYGDEYMEVNLAGEKGYFKNIYASYDPPLYDFHQYNQPTSRQDTLFLHFVSDDYRIFIR
jgi:hypothetical protein